MITNKGENLIFLLSLPRSGSTLLSAILGNHSVVHCPPEPWLLLRLNEVYGKSAENKIFDDYVASQAVEKFFGREEFIESARQFATSAYNSVLAKTNHQVLVDKTPRYYHILDFIQDIYPKAKKIWLKRHPLDVAASYKTTWNRGIDYLTGKFLDPTSFDFIVGIPNLIDFFDQKSPDKYEIKYEDLVMSPETEIKKLADFCNIPFEPAMLDLGISTKGLMTVLNSNFGDKKIKDKHTFDQASINQWKKHLDIHEIKKLNGFIGPEAYIRMGYLETVETHPEFFHESLSNEILQKTRQKVIDKFHVMNPIQMALLYDKEAQINLYESELKKSHEQCSVLKNELNATHTQIDRLKNEINRIESQLQESFSENARQVEHLTSLENRLLESKNELEKGKILSTQLEKQTRSLNEMNVLLERQLKETFEIDKSSVISQMNQQITAQGEIKKLLEQRIQDLEDDNFKNSAAIEKLKEQLRNKEEEKKSLESHVIELESIIKEKNIQNEQLELSLKNTEEEVLQLKNESGELYEKISLMEQEIDTHQNFNDQTTELLKSSEIEKKRLILTLTECENKLSKKKEEVEILTVEVSQIQGYRETISSLEKEMEELKAINSEMEETISQWEITYNKSRYSVSYRLGRVILFPMIKLRKWITGN